MPLKAYGTCSVCLDEMAGSRTVRKTPCGHVFHAACFERWRAAQDPTSRRVPCPVCRASVPVRPRARAPQTKEQAALVRYERRMQRVISAMLVRYSELYLRANPSLGGDGAGEFLPTFGSLRVVYTSL